MASAGIVTAIDPMKRGLKEYALTSSAYLRLVTAIDPMKRGLKDTSRSPFSIFPIMLQQLTRWKGDWKMAVILAGVAAGIGYSNWPNEKGTERTRESICYSSAGWVTAIDPMKRGLKAWSCDTIKVQVAMLQQLTRWKGDWKVAVAVQPVPPAM